jgi:hypothetical protein
MPNALDAFDQQHPDGMALMHGPLALFSIVSVPTSIRQQDLLASSHVSAGSAEW